MSFRKHYLGGSTIETVYFGGGTPSYLDGEDIKMICENLRSRFDIATDAEWSMELNPEDVTLEKLSILKELKFNRLTIGVQSFDDIVLKSVNRTHTPQKAIEAVGNARKLGFDNVGIDIIIGLPSSSRQILLKDLEIAKSLDLEHISLYMFSIDSGTVF